MTTVLSANNDEDKLDENQNVFFGSGFDKQKLNGNSKTNSKLNGQNSTDFEDQSPDKIELTTGATFGLDNMLETFSFSIMALAKISESLILEPTKDGLQFRAINDTKSAVAILHFAPNFFSSADTSQLDDDSHKAKNFVKISMRSALDLFKGQGKILKKNISCTLKIDPKVDYMVVEFWQTYDCLKIVQISLREINPGREFGQIRDDKQETMNYATLASKTLSKYVDQMGKDTDDLVIKATRDEMIFTKFIHEDMDKKKEKKSEAKLEKHLFEEYTIKRPTKFVVNTKYLRPILALSDHLGGTVSLYFDDPGVPMIISFSSECLDFSADFVLATSEDNALDDWGPLAPVTTMLAKQGSKSSSQTSQSTNISEHIHPSKRASKLGLTRIQSESPLRVTQFAAKFPQSPPLTARTPLEEIQNIQDQENLFEQNFCSPIQFQQLQYAKSPEIMYDDNRTPMTTTRRQQNFIDFTSSPDLQKSRDQEEETLFKHFFLSVSQRTIEKDDLWRDEVILAYDSDGPEL